MWFFFSLFLSLQTLLETKCVSEVLTQLDEQRKRGRTLTQADIVSSFSLKRPELHVDASINTNSCNVTATNGNVSIILGFCFCLRLEIRSLNGKTECTNLGPEAQIHGLGLPQNFQGLTNCSILLVRLFSLKPWQPPYPLPTCGLVPKVFELTFTTIPFSGLVVQES